MTANDLFAHDSIYNINIPMEPGAILPTHQGGPYYRNNETIPYGDTNNELVQTRVTSEDGFLNMTVSRPWAARVSDEQSVVISESSQGIILCTNVKWREV